ncbi:IclR family transcriptional regulator [Streptomyces sp. NPDC057486]|uniref:IclR family transcriptional regulator n=1 Tax=Streptomyces sp. NPDC057486 TaxID=3346145 RepID=UPI0036863009
MEQLTLLPGDPAVKRSGGRHPADRMQSAPCVMHKSRYDNCVIRNETGVRVEAVHRALVLLKLLGEEGSLSVTEAAAALEVNPSTAQRLLATLVGDGFAQQGERKRYEPGPEFLRPGMVRAVPPLRAKARHVLERLFQRVGETVHLAILVGTEIHHVDGIEATNRHLRVGLRTGVRLPAHLTSAGKAMLAELPREEVEARYHVALLGDHGRQFNLDQLHAELERTRQNRIGMNFEESESGVAAFGASLGEIDGERAAFSIALPTSRCSDDDIPEFAEHLLWARAELVGA